MGGIRQCQCQLSGKLGFDHFTLLSSVLPFGGCSRGFWLDTVYVDSSQWVRIPRSQFNAPTWHPQPACPFIIRDQKVIEFGGMSSLHREHQGHGSMPPSSPQPTCCIPKFFASPNVPIRKIEWSWLRSLPPPVVERLPRPCFNAHLWHLYLRTILQPACCIPQIFSSPREKLLTWEERMNEED